MMCTAYELGKRGGSFPEWVKADAIRTLLDVGDTPRIIRPTTPAPVITPDGKTREMVWGFRRPVPGGKTKQLWRTIVNSREDKLGGRMWSKAFQERRCLIPAAGFYEWIDGPKGKIPMRFEDPGGGLLWIAGIWEEDRERGEVFSMITTEPTDAIAPIHDRMPAVLVPGQIEPFLSHTLNEFGPSAAGLRWSEAANFLKGRGKKVIGRKLSAPPPDQGELF
jgi:putative SOS response-associated peptidase YedK